MKCTVRIALRFDDPSPTSDHSLEGRVLGVLRELGIPATFGVVPNGMNDGRLVPLSRSNVAHLVEAHRDGLIEVAQHGFSHQRLATTAQGVPSEFSGVPTHEQARMIDDGRRLISEVFGTTCDGFIPPWNTYDNLTAAHLESQGFLYLACSLVAPPAASPNICLLPCTCDIHELRHAYAEARSRVPMPAVIIAIMHHYDFFQGIGGTGSLSIGGFRDTLAWLKGQHGVEFVTLREAVETLGVRRSHAALRRLLARGRWHWRLQRLTPSGLLPIFPMWMYLRLRSDGLD